MDNESAGRSAPGSTAHGSTARGPREKRERADHSEQGVHTITTAAVSHSEELGHRERRYFISMMIRTACFVLAIVFSGWARWVFLAGAILLPYISVVLANAGVRKKGSSLDLIDPEAQHELPAAGEGLPAGAPRE